MILKKSIFFPPKIKKLDSIPHFRVKVFHFLVARKNVKVERKFTQVILAMWIAISALNLALTVMLGAFGAHGLKARATEAQLAWWQTATDYFFYHALGLLALAILAKVMTQFPIKASFLLIQVGIVFFCGSLYVMALGLPRGLGAITPIGGALMIAGWLVLAWNAMKYAR